MASHRLIITVDVDIHTVPERYRAGSAFLSFLNGKIKTTLMPAAIGQYAKSAGASIAIAPTSIGPSATASITISEDANTAPTDIALSAATIAENSAIGTTVGDLSATDPDPDATHVYTFVSGVGDTDNASFTIDDDALKTGVELDFETKSSYSVRVQAHDGEGGAYEKAFTITVTDANEAPTDIALSVATVAEGEDVGTEVGVFTTTDPDTGDTHTYTLVTGTGDDDNASFTITDDALLTGEIFDYGVKSSYTIRVQTDDGNSGLYEKQFTITITEVL